MKNLSLRLKTTALSALLGVSLLAAPTAEAGVAKKNEPHGILQVFTPAYTEWDPQLEMDTWQHHDIEILDTHGEHIRRWGHRRKIRLEPGQYLVRLPSWGSETFPVTIQDGNTKHLFLEAPGRARTTAVHLAPTAP